MANMNLNVSTQASLLPGQIQKFYDRRLLENVKPLLVHYEYGQKRPLPKHNGKTIQFRKWTKFGALTTPLVEGIVPDGQAMSQTELMATIKQYGGYVSVTDVLSLTHLDPVIAAAIEQMSDQCALTVDTLVRDVIHTGTNVMFGGTKTSRATLTPADKLTSKDIRKAVRLLKKNGAKKLTRKGNRGYYVAIVGPDTTFDLQDDPDWKAVAQYQAAEKIYDGELGKLYGVVFVETTEAKIFAGAGASSADVASTLVFGTDAYGVVDLGNVGENVRTIVKPAGSAGTADPLDQHSTIGWKVNGFTAVILQPGWLVRIEHGFSA